MYFYLQGANISQLERDIGSEQFPANEHYFGLVNVSTYHEIYFPKTLFQRVLCYFQVNIFPLTAILGGVNMEHNID